MGIMNDSLTQDAGRVGLPLIVTAPQPEAQPEWHGWSAAVPIEPQGAYTDAAPEAAPAFPPVPDGERHRAQRGDRRRPRVLLARRGQFQRGHWATTTVVPAAICGPDTWTCDPANTPVCTPTSRCAPDGSTTSRP